MAIRTVRIMTSGGLALLFSLVGCFDTGGDANSDGEGGDDGEVVTELDADDMSVVTEALLCMFESECSTTDCVFDQCLDAAAAEAGPTVNSPLYAAVLGVDLAEQFQLNAMSWSEVALEAVGVASLAAGYYTVTGRVEASGNGYVYDPEPSDRLEWVEPDGTTTTFIVSAIDDATIEDAVEGDYERPSELGVGIYTPAERDLYVEVRYGDSVALGTQAVEVGEEGRVAYFAGQIEQIESLYRYDDGWGGTIYEHQYDLQGVALTTDFIQIVDEHHDFYLGITDYTLTIDQVTLDNQWQLSDRTEYALTAEVVTEVQGNDANLDIWDNSDGTLTRDGVPDGEVYFRLFGDTIPQIVLDASFGEIVLREHL
jgi:hypothetical protein